MDEMTHDQYRKLDSAKFNIALNGLDGWLKSHMVLPPTLYAIRDGVTTILGNDEQTTLTFSDGSMVDVNTVAEIMHHMSPELIYININGRETNPDEYSIITDIIPDNILSISLMGNMLIYNTIDNSIDRSIYFRSGYAQEIYPLRFEEVINLEELLDITLVDIVRKYSDHTSDMSDFEINKKLKQHSNFNMARYYIQTLMHEIRTVQPGIDTPDTMWEIVLKDSMLHIVYMGNPHMYRLYASRLYLEREEVNENPDIEDLLKIW